MSRNITRTIYFIVLPGFEDRFAVAETVTNQLDLWPLQEA